MNGKLKIYFLLLLVLIIPGCSDTHPLDKEINIGDNVSIEPMISTAEENIGDNITIEPVIPTAEENVGNDVSIEPVIPTAKEKAESIIVEMTLEEKIGQMFFARCPSINAEENVSRYSLGGYILFASDFENRTPEEVKLTIERYQAASGIPMLIGVDEEGGTVVRASKYPAFRDEPFKSSQQLYQIGGMEEIKNDTAIKSVFLKELGINVNLAPVCDVSTNPNDFIYQRSFGLDVESTSEYVAAVVAEMEAAQIGSVLKHFPGYGNNSDTHTGIAYDNRSMEQFVNNDFLPFIAGIDAGADSILVSHNVINAIDPTLPASLSTKVHEIIREDLGFHGVIMTDDLAMEGVKSFTEADTAVLAILAHNDMVITSDCEAQITAVLDAVKKGKISESQIDASVERILLWKFKIGIIEY